MSPWIAGLRSVALNVPDLARAEAFYTQHWHLEVAGRGDNVLYLRGSGSDAYLFALHQGGDAPEIRHITLRARRRESLDAVRENVLRAGGQALSEVQELARDPAGGTGFSFQDPHGRTFQLVWGDSQRPESAPVKDRPIRLTHAVLNSHAVEETKTFLEDALGFRLADRTGIMAFMNCNSDHHTLAIGITDNDALNHIAFLMPDFEAVMRGGGRLKDAGFPIQWGPGRHGPGNNLFNYFIDPFGIVIEYTAEVQQVDDSYESHGPEYWKWPPGRLDQWGISTPPSATLKEAQKRVFFATQP